MKVLAGDVGGTKTLLAILAREEMGWKVVRTSRFRSHDHPDLSAPAREFLSGEDPLPERACFGVAGPVEDNRVEATNIPWVIDGEKLQRDLGISSVRVVNDFVSAAVGTQFLGPSDLETLSPAKPKPGGIRAVIGAGTGLGEAILVWRGNRYEAIPTEGGHAAFAPTDDLQMDLLRGLREQLGRVSVERLLSGSGLVRIYEFLRAREAVPESKETRERMASGDPAAGISEAAAERSDPLALRTLSLFAKIYGAEAGDMALRTLARGGVFIAGGIAPKILSSLKDGTFMTAFWDKGRFSDLLRSIPVHVVMNPHTPLFGAAELGTVTNL